MVKPLSPDEAALHKATVFPDGVINTWNKLIASRLVNGRAKVLQGDAIQEIMDAMGCDRTVVFDNHWLDIEDLYRAQGWSVEYDRPGYNESYSAYFVFTRAA